MRKNDVRFVFTPICFVGSSCFVNVICMYLRIGPTIFPYQMMFVSFNSNTMRGNSGANTDNSDGAPNFTPGFKLGSCCFLCNVL